MESSARQHHLEYSLLDWLVDGFIYRNSNDVWIFVVMLIAEIPVLRILAEQVSAGHFALLHA